MSLAPIVLFAYARPTHLLKTLTALKQNELFDASEFYIYCDGPKETASDIDLENIRKTREVITDGNWGDKLHITLRDQNFGLQKSIITGVTEVTALHGKAIVLEDDIITSPYFLRYMNDALDTYFNDDQVLSIGACNFFATTDDVPETFFVPIPDCWGWATWKDRWDLFEPNAQLLLTRLRENGLINDFNLDGAYKFESMLIDQIRGNVSSWAIRWQALAYLTGKLALYPRRSVTYNIGFDEGATHGGPDIFSDRIKLAKEPVEVTLTEIRVLPHVLKKMYEGYSTVVVPPIKQRTKSAIKKVILDVMPPMAKRIIKNIRPKLALGWWQGNYASWEEAKKHCVGYDDDSILKKTLDAVLKVKNGEAAYERDTVLFDKPDHNWAMLTYMLKTATENKGKLSVLDFGGALGSSYFQNLPLLKGVDILEWSIVEQPHYINAGNEHIADSNLKFYTNVDGCLKERQPNVLLLSSVLQYLPDPTAMLKMLLDLKIKYLIIDRTPIIKEGKDRLTIQTVPDYIYKASYPAWFFNERELVKRIVPHYNLMAETDPYPGVSNDLGDGVRSFYKGWVFQLKPDVVRSAPVDQSIISREIKRLNPQ
ncbi:methyltransferase, TIGR04325 family [Mucilaginibacter myungsuensis]|uniref:Methyltransferase, TIGR04325 family n=1 Tax=Mucilaginibacter myungsuensis TaxID=649104 RepID=A0A929KXP9_9SPHI|nr:methyltransferase, TIGR04325 family [Mucilaginibacter myungsuensis]MBE9660824.1 methyltransferase, TIGR04325 family [Mucilaginibacter myungsuensis]MDN3600871.1 methyltransferase, TIGR04325 family [Mucilaginibacter myungsuensis]